MAVNGAASGSGSCDPPSPAATDLLVGRYSDTALPCRFPISRLQIWNRALTATEAILTTTTDPIPTR